MVVSGVFVVLFKVFSDKLGFINVVLSNIFMNLFILNLWVVVKLIIIGINWNIELLILLNIINVLELWLNVFKKIRNVVSL